MRKKRAAGKGRAERSPDHRIRCRWCAWSIPAFYGRGRSGWPVLVDHLFDHHWPEAAAALARMGSTNDERAFERIARGR